MAIQSDVHVHSFFSSDGKATMEEMVLAAIHRGMKHICFTEHNDFDYPRRADSPEDLFLLNVDSYLYELANLKSKYEGQIQILFGMELGLMPSVLRKNLSIVKAHEFDFVLGSSHLCNGQDPYFPEFYEGKTEKQAYREYFESILENIRSFFHYDVYAHLDYIVRYGPNKNQNYHYKDHADIIDEILKTLIAGEKGLEINTGGYRNGIGTTNPCDDIIRRYHELGGEIITIGSDAHSPEFLQHHFDEVCEKLKAIGFRYYSVFENRLPEYFLL